MEGRLRHVQKGRWRAYLFCAKQAERTYFDLFTPMSDWTVTKLVPEEVINDQSQTVPLIEHEIGRCFCRLIECSEDEELVLSEVVQDAAYDLWLAARRNIYEHWTYETDPANLQPRVRPLNRKVAEFLRDNLFG